MSPVNDGWHGWRDGSFRGRRITYCRKHGDESVPYRVQCPACRLERELASAKAEAARRCEGCRLRVILEVH